MVLFFFFLRLDDIVQILHHGRRWDHRARRISSLAVSRPSRRKVGPVAIRVKGLGTVGQGGRRCRHGLQQVSTSGDFQRLRPAMALPRKLSVGDTEWFLDMTTAGSRGVLVATARRSKGRGQIEFLRQGPRPSKFGFGKLGFGRRGGGGGS